MSAGRDELAQRADALARTLPADALALGVAATLRGRPSLGPARPPPLPRVSLVEAGGAGEADLELVSVLGRGGMGEVWRARQRSLGREVAIKRLAAEHGSPEHVAALLSEARTTGGLEHPSIVPVHALGVAGEGAPLLVMKRIEGTSRQALLDDPAHPSWPALERRHGDRILAFVEILSRVCDALELAHARGVVHRDVKPENVMVGSFGETYLLDWGVALALGGKDEPIGIVGTPSYLAPEMLEGRTGAIDARTDVYLLGGTLHAALTGWPLHDGASFPAVLAQAALSEPPAHDAAVPPELAAIVRDATARDPAARIASASAFRERLAEVRAHRGSLALTREVEARLEALDRALAGAPSRREGLLAVETGRALAEARFGLSHALREWPGNEAAAAALDRVLALLCELELERESPESAAALLAERRAPDAALAARVEAARAGLAERAALADHARREAVDRDPAVRGGTRAVLVAALAFASVGANLLLFGPGAVGGAEGDEGRAAIVAGLAVDAVQIAAVGLVVLAFRRSLLANRWGRRAVALLFVTGALVLIGSFGTLVRGSDEPEQYATRNLVFGAVYAVAALDLTRRLWAAALWALAAVVLGSSWPEHAPLLTFGSMIAGVLVVVSESIRPSRARSAPPP